MFKRLMNLFAAKADAQISKLEKPEEMMPLAIKKLKERQVGLVTNAAKCEAGITKTERLLKEAEKKLAASQSVAEFHIKNAELDPAYAQENNLKMSKLANEINIYKTQVSSYTTTLTSLNAQKETLKSYIQKNELKISEFESKLNMIKTRSEANAVIKDISKSYAGLGDDNTDPVEMLDKMEDQVLTDELTNAAFTKMAETDVTDKDGLSALKSLM